jgi:hypothetical protein
MGTDRSPDTHARRSSPSATACHRHRSGTELHSFMARVSSFAERQQRSGKSMSKPVRER